MQEELTVAAYAVCESQSDVARLLGGRQEGVVAHHEGAASGGIFFHDPDGTRLEISVSDGVGGARAPGDASAPTCGFF
jgi:hypothetical protein